MITILSLSGGRHHPRGGGSLRLALWGIFDWHATRAALNERRRQRRRPWQRASGDGGFFSFLLFFFSLLMTRGAG